MKNTFNLDKNCKILLYGALANGKAFYKIFKEEGYNVIGFIDRRSDELKEVAGLQVWKIENIPIDENVVVIITIKNVFEHSKIARQLVEAGINKIIYCPENILQGNTDGETSLINDAYNTIIKRKDNVIENINEIYNIPKSILGVLYEFKDYAVINYNKDTVTAYMPIEIVFTAQEKPGFKYDWAEKSILTLPHISLFEYFDGNDNGVKDDYMEFSVYTAKLNNIEITDRWKENIIRSRQMVYNEMQKSLEIDKQFFIRSAQAAIWNNKNNYFNINGGRHRAAFFCEKKLEYIPLNISIQDYNKYLNKECLKDIIMFIEKNNMYELEVPIPHPYFYRFPARNPRYVTLIIAPIIRFISKSMLRKQKHIEFENKSLLYIGIDNGGLVRCFSRMGCNVAVYDKCNELELLINKLFYANEIKYEARKKLENYDFVYISDKHMNLSDSTIDCIVKNTRKYIFIQFDANKTENLKEKICSLNKNLKYKKLIKTYYNNSNIELGVVFIDR